mgnify:CR=1 FL=1
MATLPENSINFVKERLESVFPDSHTNNTTQITELYEVFQSIFKLLTKDEHRYFLGLYQRIHFAEDKYHTPGSLKKTTYYLLKSLKALIKTEYATPEEIINLQTKIKSIFLFYFESKFLELEDDTLQGGEAQAESLDSTMRVIVTSKSGLGSMAPGVLLYFVLNGIEEKSGEPISIVFADISKREDISRYSKVVVPGQLLCITNLVPVGSEHNNYKVTERSSVAIEPDFLIDVSDIAECFLKGNREQGGYVIEPKIYFLSKLLPSGFSAPAFRGNLVNGLLDEMLVNPTAEIDTVVDELIATEPLKAVLAGELALNQIKAEIKNKHIKNLRWVVEEYAQKPKSCEPTFISDTLGIQGRLDVMVEDASDSNRKDVFELKSGSSPKYDTWPNNRFQVLGYNLLLGQTYGKTRIGNSGIFYSAADLNPLRDIATNKAMERDYLYVRNIIVTILHKMGRGSLDEGNADTVFSRIIKNNFASFPSYSEDNIDAFSTAYQNANKIAKALYREIIAFKLRELLLAKVGGTLDIWNSGASSFSDLWNLSPAEKRNRFSLLAPLRVVSYNQETSHITLEISEHCEHNFREGDICVLYGNYLEGSNALSERIVKGNIKTLTNSQVVVSLRNRSLNPDFFNKAETWYLEHDLFERNYWSVIQGSFCLLTTPQEKVERSLGLIEPQKSTIEFNPSAGLNDNQNLLIQQALEAEDYFLLQGPPGTGKTSTMLVELVKRILLSNSQKITIAAFTNRATDEICTKLRENSIQYVRLGNKNGDDENTLKLLSGTMGIDELAAHIRNTKVLVTTTATLSNEIESIKQFFSQDVLIVDESSQLTMADSLGIVLQYKKFILIGDQNQLPPVIMQSEEMATIHESVLAERGINRVSISLFEHLMKQCKMSGWEYAYGMLETHFRMHKDIASLINPAYGNKLTIGAERQQSKQVSEPLTTLSDFPSSRAVFWNSPRATTPKQHRVEAERVRELTMAIYEHYNSGFTADTLGIVTPWRAQVVLIKSLLPESLREQVLVDTVERFQGSEKDIIIISTALNSPAQLQALQSIDTQTGIDRKLIVALSRAREQVILLGVKEILESTPEYKAIISLISQHGGVVEIK